MFSVTLLPAHQGDCIWIEYGDKSEPHRILIDAGTPPTYEKTLRPHLESLGPNAELDLFVVTHIDTDHIGGVLKLLDDPPPGLNVAQVWFNAWRHIAPETKDLMGPIDGEILSCQLEEKGWAWNGVSFRGLSGSAVGVPLKGKLPSVTLDGGMKLTVLSPGPAQLANLRKNWKDVCRKAGLEPGQPAERLKALAKRKGAALDLLGSPRATVRAWADRASMLDSSVANGSTIALLAEYEGVACLLPGDSFSTTLTESLTRLLNEREGQRLKVDLVKLPHHGSRYNVTKDLFQLLDCRHFLFSTNGAVYRHPDLEAVARVVVNTQSRPVLSLNYSQPTYSASDFMTASNGQFGDPRFVDQIGCSFEYGDDNNGITVEFS